MESPNYFPNSFLHRENGEYCVLRTAFILHLCPCLYHPLPFRPRYQSWVHEKRSLSWEVGMIVACIFSTWLTNRPQSIIHNDLGLNPDDLLLWPQETFQSYFQLKTRRDLKSTDPSISLSGFYIGDHLPSDLFLLILRLPLFQSWSSLPDK